MDLLEFISGFNKYAVGIYHIPGSVIGNGAWKLTETWPRLQEAYGPVERDTLLHDVIIVLMEARGAKEFRKDCNQLIW